MDTLQESKKLWEKSQSIIHLVKWTKTNPHDGMTLYNGKYTDWRFNSIRMDDKGTFIYEGVLIYKNIIVRLRQEDWANTLFNEAEKYYNEQPQTKLS